MMSEDAPTTETSTAATAVETNGSAGCAESTTSNSDPQTSAVAVTAEEFVDMWAKATHSWSTEAPVVEEASGAPAGELPEVEICPLALTGRCCSAWRREEAKLAKSPIVDWTDIINAENDADLAPWRINANPVRTATPLLTIEQIAAIDNLEQRAEALVANEVYGTCETIRQLILSVEDAGFVGWEAQLLLSESGPSVPKKRPARYRRKRPRPPEIDAGNLFEAFGIDIDGGAND
jgi:hypothetical protein